MRPVRIVPYDAAWPGRFAEERARLAAALAAPGLEIEHVGSTAVPGLGSKPIIDIMVGVEDLAIVEAGIPGLDQIGYRYVPDYEDVLPERRYFRKSSGGLRTHHLHCVVRGTPFWERHLAFRDALRERPDLAAEYGALKARLARAFGTDREGYTDAKGSFIEAVLAGRSTSPHAPDHLAQGA